MQSDICMQTGICRHLQYFLAWKGTITGFITTTSYPWRRKFSPQNFSAFKTKIFLFLYTASDNNATFLPCTNCPKRWSIYFVQYAHWQNSLELPLIKWTKLKLKQLLRIQMSQKDFLILTDKLNIPKQLNWLSLVGVFCRIILKQRH